MFSKNYYGSKDNTKNNPGYEAGYYITDFKYHLILYKNPQVFHIFKKNYSGSFSNIFLKDIKYQNNPVY